MIIEMEIVWLSIISFGLGLFSGKRFHKGNPIKYLIFIAVVIGSSLVLNYYGLFDYLTIIIFGVIHLIGWFITNYYYHLRHDYKKRK